MGKKPKTPSKVPTETNKLTHSPFASLAGAGVARGREATAADEPAGPGHPPPPDAAASGGEAPGLQPSAAHPPEASTAGQRVPSAAGAAPHGAVTASAGASTGKARGRLVLRRETQHRGGKPVVIVGGFASTGLAHEEIEALGSTLKRALGCGGTIERAGDSPEIVLQGDHPAKVAELLRTRGFRVGGVTH